MHYSPRFDEDYSAGQAGSGPNVGAPKFASDADSAEQRAHRQRELELAKKEAEIEKKEQELQGLIEQMEQKETKLKKLVQKLRRNDAAPTDP